jgi:hypothetical protein
MYAGGRPIKVKWLTITDIGREALARHVAAAAGAEARDAALAAARRHARGLQRSAGEPARHRGWQHTRPARVATPPGSAPGAPPGDQG